MPAPKKADLAKEVAAKIYAYLKKWEADKDFNKVDKYKVRRLWQVHARANRGGVDITYVGYHGGSHLELEDAVRYLAWLDEGNVGEHHAFLREHHKPKNENICYIPSHRPNMRDPLGPESVLSEDKDVYKSIVDAYFDALHVFFPKIAKPKNANEYGAWGEKSRCVPKSVHPIGSFPTWHEMTPEQQSSANELFDTISYTIHLAYGRGLEHGRSLLAQLATGEITIGEFEKGARRED